MCQKIFGFWYLDVSCDYYKVLHLLLEKQEETYLMMNEGNVCRTEMIIDPLYLV